jgi:hypothetical protein
MQIFCHDAPTQHGAKRANQRIGSVANNGRQLWPYL